MSDDPLRRYGHLKFDISRGVHLGGGGHVVDRIRTIRKSDVGFL